MVSISRSNPSIQFNRSENIIGIAPDLLILLGLEDHLSKYKAFVSSEMEWVNSMKGREVTVNLYKGVDYRKIEAWGDVRTMLDTDVFRSYYEKLDRPKILVYKPTGSIEEISRRNKYSLLANSCSLRWELENKVLFRERFHNIIKIPEYEILSKAEVMRNKDFSTTMINKYSKFVVQDEKITGGKGTFIISREEDWERASELLNEKGGEKLIISKFIDGESASVQCCVTKYGTISSGIQKQLIALPSCYNPEFGNKESFCGGEWGTRTYSESIHSQVKDIVKKVGNNIMKDGYKGIFGIDFIISKDEIIYSIEINARLTYMTHFLTMSHNLNNEIPLLLLHVLELGNIDYSVEDPSVFDHYHKRNREGFSIIFHNKLNNEVKLNSSFKEGIYTFEQGTGNLSFSHSGYNLTHIENDDQVMLIPSKRIGDIIKPGGRIVRIISSKTTNYSSTLIERITKSIRDQYMENVFN